MGRRELRAEVQSTWTVYEPRVPGTPFYRKDVRDADERFAQGVPPRPSCMQPPSSTEAERHGGATPEPRHFEVNEVWLDDVFPDGGMRSRMTVTSIDRDTGAITVSSEDPE